MKVVRHESPGSFLGHAGALLERAEAENNLILGLAATIIAHPERYDQAPYLFTVEDEGDVVAAALMTPPHKIVITRAPAPALMALADHFVDAGIDLPGVLGPSADAMAFAGRFVARTSKPCRTGMSQRIYECDRVLDVPPVPGRLRLAAPDEEPWLTEWGRRFYVDVGDPGAEQHVAELAATVRARIGEGRLSIWEDGRPVSMAALSGDTPQGIRVGFVYTPPDLRGRGYATACVAELTRRTLAGGRRFCFLYTDLSNPTSNRIYQRIGYRPVCDCQDYLFG